ncbi:flagellar assembly regulator FliX [Roseibium sp. TrichSKD4]|uniref:flagellar assembly protein FliX n=1 Tax=Roseibium sp. TrichSKD4 TaxID=744980 RepID=UPI0001E56A46|nr:flagellar assembly protein FliX [Roseibium sp. TrichSKD4]EFO30768.1 flagellar assembly regulator FliX [Roseibium sp. TrichSKD4]
MRITGKNPISGVQGRGGKKKVGGDGATFQPDMGDGASSAGAVTGGTSIQGMDALLSLQEVLPRNEQHSQATRRGHSLLDGLEALRAELLGGLVPEDKLEALANEVENRIESGDPQIDGVIDEIELRVKVELAKLGRFER